MRLLCTPRIRPRLSPSATICFIVASSSGSLGGAVGNHFHGPEHALAANLADLRVLVVQSGELRAEHVLADGVGVVDDVLLFHGFLGGHDGAHGQRVTGVGQAAGEDDVVEAVGHRVAHNHAAGGHVTGVAALAKEMMSGV